MGMYGNFFRTDEITVQKLKKGKESLWTLFQQCHDENWNAVNDCVLGIDKTWHAIHFTLSGKAGDAADTPLSKVILNGNPLNDEDMGYGPAMLITAQEVLEINHAFRAVSEEWFRKRFSVPEMLANQIYPLFADEDEDAFFEYVYPYFKDIVSFFKKAGENRQCILFFVS